MSLRWIMVHMIEEYARHNGHADFLRELHRRRGRGVSGAATVAAGTGEGGGGGKRQGAITTVHRYELPLPRETVWSLIGQVQGFRPGGRGCASSRAGGLRWVTSGAAWCSRPCRISCGSGW